MDKDKFDLNSDALDKIDEQYEYAADRVSNDPFSGRATPPKHPNVQTGRGSVSPKKPAKPANPVKPPKPQKPVRRDAPAPEPQAGYSVYEGIGSPREQAVHDAREAYAAYEAYVPQPEPIPEPEPQPSGKKRGRKLLQFYRRFAVFIIVLGIIYIALNVAFLYFRGQLWFNEPRARDYPVRGAVVSSDLGEVDWEVFQYAPLKFAYVRATKGIKFVDEQFADNRKGIDESRLWAGYYHEFDFSEEGEKQAEHFINTVGDLYGDLRPAVKLTAYGIYGIRMKNGETVKKELSAFLKKIKEQYGRRAVVMCDNDCYEKYVKPYFSEQTLWIIDHFNEPSKDMDWALWEYNPRVRSEGYSNEGEYYAVTVYRLGKDLRNFRKNFEIGFGDDDTDM